MESYCVGNSCLPQSGFQALVDSGASFTFLPTEIYAEVVMKVLLFHYFVVYMLSCYAGLNIIFLDYSLTNL